MPNALSVIDLFCGAGGFSLGFEQAGFEVLAGVDNDTRAVDAYRKNFPQASAITGDVASLDGGPLMTTAEVSSCTVVIGGPPCQAFSIAGKMREDDARRDLVAHFARMVDGVWPEYFVMENVPGIQLPKAEPVIAYFKEYLESAGYHISEPWVLNATDFKVPQRRRRVFFVGALAGLPLPERPCPIFVPQVTAGEAIDDLREDRSPDEIQISWYASMMRGEHSSQGAASENGNGIGFERVDHTDEVIERFASVAPGCTEPISRFYRLHPDRPAPTLRAGTLSDRGSHTAARPIHYALPRCITVREAARLQSMPDSFHVDPTKWRGYMQVGNSVPPLMARAVAEQIRAAASCRPARAAAVPNDLPRTG